MPTDPKVYIDFANSEASSRLTDDIKNELIAEGFPGYMCYSFIETAKATNSIVLSRLPGGVGTDLIEQGYDLKGFHIKAKSCNWGPMAGFICQLPVFNKLGIDKVLYNTKEIIHYLAHLDHFSGAKVKIAKFESDRAAEIKESPSREKAINEKFNKLILDVLTEARTAEERSGEWSGENGLEDGHPFIHLRRKFENLKAIEDMRGVVEVVEIRAGLVYGIAQNVTDELNKTNNKPTVITEFLLEKMSDDVWDIYHGRIKYKSKDTDAAFNKEFPGTIIADLITGKVDAKNNKFVEQIFIRGGDALIMKNPETLAKMKSKDGLFGVQGGAIFYKIRGFVNPFPPFKKSETAKYYKNAVSGDYDLFGIWPDMTVHQDELTRQSELVTGKFTRIGGKMFTTYFGNKGNFAIEFVPGFSELNPNGKVDILRESAEYGNMNSLGHLVSGYLNSFGASFITAFADGKKSTANKGFHSDEGGRPGIMEIEFPIAVFMPKKLNTKVLNNKTTRGIITPIADRTAIETFGGLIKTPDELLVFILECMDKNYRIFMHYRWMIHLLYNSIPLRDVDTVFKAALESNLDKLIEYNKGFTVAKADKKEFDAIKKNKVILDALTPPTPDAFSLNLRKILDCEIALDGAEFFEAFRYRMLSYAFLSEQPSYQKKTEVENMMYSRSKRPNT
jgi:hypothetical protein